MTIRAIVCFTNTGDDDMTIDRAEASRALAKAIAYKQCGKDDEAAAWATRLVELLECHRILAHGADQRVRNLHRVA